MLILRGEKLQLAMRMLAEGKMSDEAIAKRLHVKGKMLQAVRDLPFFERRADQIREELNQNLDAKKRVASEGSFGRHTDCRTAFPSKGRCGSS
jgi:hypothetical protein